MSLFEFLMVLVSLIIGLGIAELLSGVAQAIRNRGTAKLYWIHSTFIVVVFFALLQTWWEIWGIRETPVWTFLGLLMMLGGPIGLFLISHLLFPERMAESDLRSYYYDKMTPALWIAVLTVLISSTFRPLILGEELIKWDNLSSLFLVAAFSSMALTKNSVFHAFVIVLVLSALLGDILLVNMEIQ